MQDDLCFALASAGQIIDLGNYLTNVANQLPNPATILPRTGNHHGADRTTHGFGSQRTASRKYEGRTTVHFL